MQEPRVYIRGGDEGEIGRRIGCFFGRWIDPLSIGLKFGREESRGVERQMFFLLFFLLWKILFGRWILEEDFFSFFPLFSDSV